MCSSPVKEHVSSLDVQWQASEETPAEISAGAEAAESGEAAAQPNAAAKGQEEKAEDKKDKEVAAPEKAEGERAAVKQAQKEGEGLDHAAALPLLLDETYRLNAWHSELISLCTAGMVNK